MTGHFPPRPSSRSILFIWLAVLALGFGMPGPPPCAPPAPFSVPHSPLAPPGEAKEGAPETAASEGTLNPEDPPAPNVLLSVRVPAMTSAGEIEYRIHVENNSAAPAHHVLLRNPMPANAKLVRAVPEPNARGAELLWRLGTLDAGGSRDLLLVLAPSGPGTVENCTRVQFEHGECVRTRVTRPRLQLVKEGPTEAVRGDPLTYRLTVTNTGDADATQVALRDALAAGLEPVEPKAPLMWDLGTLAPGQSRSVEYRAKGRTLGRHCNHARVDAAGGIHEEAASCVVIGEPALSMTKTGPAQRYLNLPASYQIRVKNPGTAAAEKVVVTETLPEKTNLVSADEGGRVEGREIRWELGTLGPGESRVVALVLRATEAGSICDRAEAHADRGLTATAETCTEFLGVPGLLLEVVDTVDPVAVGETTDYIINVRNQGTLPATKVRVMATVPAELALVRVTGPVDHHREGARVLFEPLTIPASSQARYIVTARGLRPGDLRFKVELTADQLPSGPVHEEESTTVYAEAAAGP